MDKLSELLQQCVNALQIATDDDAPKAIQNRYDLIAKNHGEQALLELKKIMGSEYKEFFNKPLI